MAGGKRGRRGDRHINVQGNYFEGSIRAKNFDARVNVSPASDAMVRAAAADLVRTLDDHDLLRDPVWARPARDLQEAVGQPRLDRSRVRNVLRQIEEHAALTAGLPAAVTAALEAVKLISGG